MKTHHFLLGGYYQGDMQLEPEIRDVRRENDEKPNRHNFCFRKEFRFDFHMVHHGPEGLFHTSLPRISVCCSATRTCNIFIEITILFLGVNNTQLIIRMMRAMENLTSVNGAQCIQFREKNSSDTKFITIYNGNGCHAPVGSWGNYVGFRGVSLMDSSSGTCMVTGTIQHELNHVLGEMFGDFHSILICFFSFR